MTNSLYNYLAYKTKNRWCSVDAHFNVLSGQYLLPSIIVWRIIWTYWLPFSKIETQHFGKAEPRNLLAQVALIQLKFRNQAKWFMSPTIHLFMNKYPHATAQSSPIIFLQPKFSVKQHIEPGENILTYSDLLFLVSFFAPCFHRSVCHQPQFTQFHWHLCWPNLSGNI